jgi:hypothetical protein
MMVQKITQQNQVAAARTARAGLVVVQAWRLGTAAADFYLTPSMPTKILRLGRFAPSVDDDRYETIATMVAHKTDARGIHNEHFHERGHQIYGQIT